MKARATKKMREKDSAAIGGMQVESDSRFVLTKRNDSFALDAREMDQSRKKKPNVQVTEADLSDHNGLAETEGKLTRSRICQSEFCRRREEQSEGQN